MLVLTHANEVLNIWGVRPIPTWAFSSQVWLPKACLSPENGLMFFSDLTVKFDSPANYDAYINKIAGEANFWVGVDGGLAFRHFRVESWSTPRASGHLT